MALLLVVGRDSFQASVSRVVEIETATVTLQYPSSSITLLNASGYVVAQRKAALAAKATGRLEWLGVEEGSRVKKGEIIARLEGLDAEAVQKQAAAGVTAAAATAGSGRSGVHGCAAESEKGERTVAAGGYVPG